MQDRRENIRQLGELIKGIDVAMFTTVDAQGRLVSRPLGTQEVEFDGDLRFATEADSPKVDEILADPRVNVSYSSPSKNTYVSIAGRAHLVNDRARIEKYWSPAMALFFPEGKDDPNLRLIRVSAESAEYWNGPGTLLGKALYFVMTAVTDDPGNLSDNQVIDLKRGR